MLALNQSSEVPLRMNALIEAVASQPADFKIGWSFEGTKHFAGQNEKLSPYRVWLEQLFAALAEPTRDQIVKAVSQTKAAFK